MHVATVKTDESAAAVIDLDDTDRALLRAARAGRHASAGALGRALGLSQPAAWRRIRRLERRGCCRGGGSISTRRRWGSG